MHFVVVRLLIYYFQRAISACCLCLFPIMSQTRGTCGHLKSVDDTHPLCLACAGCSQGNTCQWCEPWSDSLWARFATRKTHRYRREHRSSSGSSRSASRRSSPCPSLDSSRAGGSRRGSPTPSGSASVATTGSKTGSTGSKTGHKSIRHRSSDRSSTGSSVKATSGSTGSRSKSFDNRKTGPPADFRLPVCTGSLADPGVVPVLSSPVFTTGLEEKFSVSAIPPTFTVPVLPTNITSPLTSAVSRGLTPGILTGTQTGPVSFTTGSTGTFNVEPVFTATPVHVSSPVLPIKSSMTIGPVPDQHTNCAASVPNQLSTPVSTITSGFSGLPNPYNSLGFHGIPVPFGTPGVSGSPVPTFPPGFPLPPGMHCVNPSQGVNTIPQGSSSPVPGGMVTQLPWQQWSLPFQAFPWQPSPFGGTLVPPPPSHHHPPSDRDSAPPVAGVSHSVDPARPSSPLVSQPAVPGNITRDPSDSSSSSSGDDQDVLSVLAPSHDSVFSLHVDPQPTGSGLKPQQQPSLSATGSSTLVSPRPPSPSESVMESEPPPRFSFDRAINEVFRILPADICPRVMAPAPARLQGFMDFGEESSSTDHPCAIPMPPLVPQLLESLEEEAKGKTDSSSWSVSSATMSKKLKFSPSLYKFSGESFPVSLPSLDQDASRLDLRTPSSVSISLKTLERWEARFRQLVGIAAYSNAFTAALHTSLKDADSLSQPSLLLLEALNKSSSHSMGVAMASSSEMLRSRREAHIPSSSVLSENARRKLRTVPLASRSLFGGVVGEVAEAEQSDKLRYAAVGSSFRKPSKRPPQSKKGGGGMPKKPRLTSPAKPVYHSASSSISSSSPLQSSAPSTYKVARFGKKPGKPSTSPFQRRKP